MLGNDCFVTSGVEERTVKLPGKGGEQKLWFRKVSSYDWERFIECVRAESADQRAMKSHVLIAASLCDPDGEAAMSLEKVRTLRPKVAAALFAEAFAVNQPKDDEPGNA